MVVMIVGNIRNICRRPNMKYASSNTLARNLNTEIERKEQELKSSCYESTFTEATHPTAIH